MNEMSTIPSGASAVLPRNHFETHSAAPGKVERIESSLSTSETKLEQPKVANVPREATPAPSERPSRAELSDTTQELNKQFSALNTNLQFNLDDDSGEMVVKVIDRESKEVIRQIPPEKALALAKFLREMELDQSQALLRDKRGNGLQNGRATLEGLLIRVKV